MLLRVLNIVVQVTILGSLVGIVVSLLSLGFVYGVKEISSFRQSYGICSFKIYDNCFSYAPLIFLFISAAIILTVKKLLHISRYHGPADVILTAHSNSENLDPKPVFYPLLLLLFPLAVEHQ